MEQNKSYKFSKITLLVILAALLVTAFVFGENKTEAPQNPIDPTEIVEPSESCTNEVANPEDIFGEMDKKPIIYLYPTEETEVSVTLGKPESITCSYPKYENGWNVLAKPDGTLIDLETERELYALYYEANVEPINRLVMTGFVVQKEDIATFLEEKLAILGLNNKEAEEFIIYWLPVLEQSEYNYIFFASETEINNNMPLNISPAPDTLIRVRMYFKGLDEPITISEQQLTPVERTGFTVVEWGGVELNNIVPHQIKMPCGGIRVPRVRIPKLGGNN